MKGHGPGTNRQVTVTVLLRPRRTDVRWLVTQGPGPVPGPQAPRLREPPSESLRPGARGQ
eukprot:757699-Hanusia_phi.AAC.3